MKFFLSILEVIVAALLIGIVIMQPSEDSSLGNIRSGDFLSGRRGANFLTRTTAVLACLFFLLCLGIGILNHRAMSHSPVDKLGPTSDTAKTNT